MKTITKFIEKIKINEAVAQALDQDLNDFVTPMTESKIREFTPVDTTTLRSSMTGRRKGFLEHEVATNVPYAIYVEFGTWKMAPRAMMRKGGEAVGKMSAKFLKNLQKLK